jgi:ribokinase
MPTPDLLFLGGSSIDLYLRVPRLPEGGDKMVARFEGRLAGGLVSNAACAARRLGLKVAWSGLLGDDEAGKFLLDDFSRFGVDTSLAEVRAGESSDFCVILLEPDGERTILVVNTLPGPPPLSPGVRAAISQAKVIYCLPYSLEWIYQLAQVAHAGGCRLALDIESSCPLQGEALTSALRQADIVFCNTGGLTLATGMDGAEEGAPVILALGPRQVIITQGAKGAYGATEQEIIFSSAFHVPVVDSTGAGDAFHAAYLCKEMHGASLAERLRFANAAAALSVQKIGARAALPAYPDVEAFLASHVESLS